MDELLAAIAPDTEIHIAYGTYDLTAASDYGKTDSSRYYCWNNCGYDEYELCVEDIDGLTLIGDNAEILTVPRSANVLSFKYCDNLSLQGLTVGHTEAAFVCEGGVIKPSVGGVLLLHSGERLNGSQEVSGSIPLISTKQNRQVKACLFLLIF